MATTTSKSLPTVTETEDGGSTAAEQNLNAVMDSSTQGAQMLIQLREGSNAVFNQVQVLVNESRSEREQADGDVAVALAEGHTGTQVFHVAVPVVSQKQTKKSSSVGIQANDYEIERRSGVVPARQRLIPYKFRDFQNPDDIKEEDPDDEDYHPEDLVLVKKVRLPRPGSRPVGRPRKIRTDHAYDKANEATVVKEDITSSQVEGEIGKEEEEEIKPPGIPKRGRPSKNEAALAQLKGYSCLDCDKKFTLKGNLKVHMRTHTDERPFKCEVENCLKSFRSNESLRRHVLAHKGIKLFGCDICQKRFASNVGLKEHIARHTDTKPQICHICQRAFRQVSCLRRHLMTHSKEQPHECEECGKRFSQLVYLRSHARSHTGERPFKCDTCGRAFAHQSDVARHMRIHQGTKPYECDVCGARFSDPSTRRRHVREHNGFKPYSCQLCGDNFKRSGQLKAHLNKKHMNYKEEVVITKEGPFNSLQFQFKGNRNTGVGEQMEAEGAPMNQPQYVQVTNNDGKQEVIALTAASAQESVQFVDEHGQIQQVQVQMAQQVDGEEPVILGQLQQQIVQAGFNQSQVDGNQIILTQANSGKEELLEETQRIIQQIQSQLEPAQGTGEEGGQQVKVAYHILHDDDNQQIVQIQYHPVGEAEERQVQENVLTVLDDGQNNQVQIADETNPVVQTHEHIKIQEVYTSAEVLPDNIEPTQENIHIRMVETEDSITEGSSQMETHTVQEMDVLPDNQQTHYVEYQEVVENNPQPAMDQAEHIQVMTEHQNEPQAEIEVEQTQQFEMDIVEEAEQADGSNEADLAVIPEENQASSQEQVVSDTGGEPKAAEPEPEGGTVLTFETLEQQQQAASVDYVSNPDFNSQEYYNWLSNFTELCKLVPMPLSVELFQKMSQVHKTLSDVLATPRGILTNKDNFRTLMNISTELNGIINEHLSFVFQQLDTDIPMK